jgi:P-type Cu+ transporter
MLQKEAIIKGILTYFAARTARRHLMRNLESTLQRGRDQHLAGAAAAVLTKIDGWR